MYLYCTVCYSQISRAQYPAPSYRPARALSPDPASYSAPAPRPAPGPPSKFRSLEDECNWILSGREPLDGLQEEEDDATLDDISGDEVSKLGLALAWRRLLTG